jgi:Kef-type K+ transport system membrane component KefB
MEPLHSVSFLIFLIGLLIVASVTLRVVLERTFVPPLIGFITLGFLVRLGDLEWDLISTDGKFALDVLAELGIIALLFRIGLESNLAGLLRQLPTASFVWIGDVAVSAAIGYVAMAYVLGFDTIPSLIAASALTATSLGVSVGMWREHKALGTEEGELLTDVAEMDDLSGIAIMAVLFAILPVARAAASLGTSEMSSASLSQALISIIAILLAKFGLFSLACFLFARYGELHLRRSFERLASPPELVVLIGGTGILISGAAAWLGFSAAIGALFAGLAFSRDPESVKVDAGFRGIYHLLAPFFFIGIGLSLDPAALGSAIWAGAALTIAAVAGKLLGVGLPAYLSTSVAGATLIGVSMVPRAEITMIIMEHGQQLGPWAVPPQLYAAMVIVSAVTCSITPLVLGQLFHRYSDSLHPEGRTASSRRKPRRQSGTTP